MKMYSLSCKDAGMAGCDYVAMADSQDEVMNLAMEHAHRAHPEETSLMLEKMTDEEIREQMESKVKEIDDDL